MTLGQKLLGDQDFCSAQGGVIFIKRSRPGLADFAEVSGSVNASNAFICAASRWNFV